MKIGIISDSHDNLVNVRKAVSRFKKERSDLVIHLGDFVSPPMIMEFKGLNLLAVFGNNDGEKFKLIKTFQEIGGEIKGGFFETELDGLKTAIYHGTESGITQALIGSGKYDLVLTGHTHKRMEAKKGKTLAINPGTAHGFGGEATIALFDTITKKTKFVRL